MNSVIPSSVIPPLKGKETYAFSLRGFLEGVYFPDYGDYNTNDSHNSGLLYCFRIVLSVLLGALLGYGNHTDAEYQ